MDDAATPLFPKQVYAFPFDIQRPGARDLNPGMSLRDWFAGQALAGIMADPSVTGTEQQIAERMYRYADAMMKAREER